jgi:hypothetical protein
VFAGELILNGSRAPYGARRKCEDRLPLDIRQLKGRLLVGAAFPWQWTQAGSLVADVQITVGSRALALSYRTGGHDVSQRLEFAWTFCFGGLRTWFICPDCKRRAAILYGVNRFGRFSCRKCMNLAYECEAETTSDRLARKMLKREAKLGEWGERPKGMWGRTYRRVCAGIDEAANARCDALMGALGTNSATAGSGEAR